MALLGHMMHLLFKGDHNFIHILPIVKLDMLHHRTEEAEKYELVYSSHKSMNLRNFIDPVKFLFLSKDMEYISK